MTCKHQLSALVAIVLLPWLASCDSSASATPETQAPVTVVNAARSTVETNDFLRLVFLPAGVEPSGRLGAPGSVRVFTGASAMFDPPLSLAQVADFFGVFPAADRELLAMRCSPQQRTAVDARLATWPETMQIIQEDLGTMYTCPPPEPIAPENEVYCLAASYVDPPDALASRAIGAAMELGAEILDNTARADVMRRRYGIFPSFTGLGYTARGSSSGAPLTARETLRESISSEYLLLNATLADAGCACIRVAPYAGREDAPLSINFIEQRGDASCARVSRLGS